MKRLLAAAVLVCVTALPGLAHATFEDGLTAYEQGRFDHALGEFRPLAQRGHPGAEFMLGVMHFNGFGVDRNEVVAAIYFRQAAEQGEPGAQLAFGSLHIRGIGVFQNLIEARKWLTICARSDSPDVARQASSLLAVTATLMTADEISRADRVAARWRPVRAGLVRER
jgi:TPR repeat protein